MAIKRVLGIDFGTSSSIIKVKTYKDGEPLGAKEHVEYIRFDGAAYCPTLVYKADDGSLFFGHKAESAAVRGVLHQNFKMDLAGDNTEKREAAASLTQLFFNHLFAAYDDARSLFPPCEEEVTYVSYPAKWSENERGLMVKIAERAGFKTVVGIDEPSAAIHAVMVSASDKLLDDDEETDEINLLLIDMGAGTTDLVLCAYHPYANEQAGERQIDVLNVWPKSGSNLLMGGREIDLALCEYVKKYLISCGLPNPRNFNDKYMDKCRTWKETNVSPILNDNGTVRYAGFVDALLSMMDIDEEFPPLARDGLELMLADYIAQLPKMVNGCLSEVGFKPGAVDFVVLTGGHSQWYFVGGVVNGDIRQFGNVDLPRIKADHERVIRLPWPQETVAYGMVFLDIPVAKRVKPAELTVSVLRHVSEMAKADKGRDVLLELFADARLSRELRRAATACAQILNTEKTALFELTYKNPFSGAAEELRYTINNKDIVKQKALTSIQQVVSLAGEAKQEPPKAPPPKEPPLKAPAAYVFCQNCGNPMSPDGRFCNQCGHERISAQSAPAPASYNAAPPDTALAAGNLIKTFPATYSTGLREVSGNFFVYKYRIMFVPHSFQIRMHGDKFECPLSFIDNVSRDTILGMNIAVRFNFKDGSSRKYGFGGIKALGGQCAPEVFELIQRQMKGVSG